MHVKTLIPAALAAIVPVLAGCGNDEPDAYGNFEANEMIVSAEGSGRLLSFDAAEGARLSAGEPVGLIDTTQLSLQRRDLIARRDAARARVSEVGKQIDVLQTQRQVAEREYERARRLFEAQAATAQQLDRADRDYRTLGDQIEALRRTRAAVSQEIESIEAQIALVNDRIRKSRITVPMAGTVLAAYVEPGEFVQTGQPLLKAASLDTLILRAFVSGSQLGRVKLGGTVQVRIDAGGDELRSVGGTISWVSSEAEFTPTPIQTREERTDQVYAVKVRVPNPDGVLKIGMPGEVVLPEP